MIEASCHPGTLTHYTSGSHMKQETKQEAKQQAKQQESPALKNFKPRLYQETIFHTAMNKNILVVLPTGLGKTSIAFMLALKRLQQFPNQKILFLAPTKPLVDQHRSSFVKYTNINPKEINVFTGHVKPEKREKLWKTSKIICSTPQGLENDIINGRIKLEETSLIIFDEAHRATGEYAYNFIAKQYHKKAKYPKLLGLTASPGSDLEKIMEIFQNLFLEDVEIRTPKDLDVAPYIQETNVTWVKVALPETFKDIQKLLKTCFQSKLRSICENGYLKKDFITKLSKTQLLRLQGQLHREIAQGNKDFEVLKSISLCAEAMKIQHGLELLETQGISALRLYLESIQQQSLTSKVKAVKNLARDPNFKAALFKTIALDQAEIEHPKLEKLKELLTKEIGPRKKIIVFNQYRDMAAKIVDEINTLSEVKAQLFVGQAKKRGNGLSQKKQKELIEKFSNNEFNVLVTTSVAEEGLDIPQVNTVIFYEPIPSEIRHIQRRGRTGRHEKGKVLILLAQNTRDEGYRWSAFHKEKRMHRNLDELKKKITKITQQVEQQQTIVSEKPILILVDDREKGSGIIKDMFDLGASVRLKRLAVGDYLLSPKCIVEFKTIPDFVDSIIDGRLLTQAKTLKQHCERPILIIQGTEDIYAQRKIHPNAIRGMLATLTVEHGISVLYTKHSKDTANLLTIIAKREQQEPGGNFTFHNNKPLTLKEKQEFIVSSLPGIGPTLCKPLLQAFGSIKNVMNANVQALQEIDKIGPKKAKEIQTLLHETYKG